MKRMFIKISLLLALASLAAWPPLWAGQISEEQKEDLFHMAGKEDLVEAPTRHLKPVSRSAMNISVLDAEDLKNLNSHTLAEALNRVPGVYVSFAGADFGGTSLLKIHAGESRHSRVMIDGIDLNTLNGGAAETHGIPVGIISRVEIVKNVTSSTWGSALGGTINIITKNWDASYDQNLVSASYGAGCNDYRAEMSGKGFLNYYLYVGFQSSNGLRDTRDFQSRSLYAKFQKDVNSFTKITASGGFNDPEASIGDVQRLDISQNLDSRIFWSAASLESILTGELTLDLSIRYLSQKFDIANNSLGLGLNGPPGALYMANLYDETSMGASGKLVFERPNHLAVLGVDFDRGELDQTASLGPRIVGIAGGPKSTYDSSITKYAIFANDTISYGKWTLVPSLRYDWNNRTGSFFSPSLGVVYSASKNTIIRGSVGRGFTTPPISWTTGGALFLEPNPSLDVEKVWSFQAGVESRALKYIRVKASVFHHEIEDILKRVPNESTDSPYDNIIINSRDGTRNGVEFELETAPFYNFSFWAGFGFSKIDPPIDHGAECQVTTAIAFRFDAKSSFRTELFGHYVNWDVDNSLNPNYDFIWDFNVRKEILTVKNTSLELFCTLHNIFDGSQYWSFEYMNPSRWGEVGIRIYF